MVSGVYHGRSGSWAWVERFLVRRELLAGVGLRTVAFEHDSFKSLELMNSIRASILQNFNGEASFVTWMDLVICLVGKV